MKSRISFLILLAVLLGLATAFAQTTPDPKELVAVEQTFATAVDGHGIKAGFLQFLAPDGIIFRPGPVNGVTYLKDKPESPAKLAWEPEHAAITSAGDFGWTTGPWKWRADSTEPATLFGQYLSIWQKQGDGAWKMVLDVGVVYPDERKVSDVGFATMPAVSVDPFTDDQLAAARAELMALDSMCASAIAAPDVLLLRTGQGLIMGAAARSDYLANNPGVASCRPMSAAVSAHGEFGYTYGTGQFLPDGADADEFEPVGYAHLWKRDTEGIWQLAADVVVPLPHEEKEDEQ